MVPEEYPRQFFELHDGDFFGPASPKHFGANVKNKLGWNPVTVRLPRSQDFGAARVSNSSSGSRS
jgi:hypothetical protein